MRYKSSMFPNDKRKQSLYFPEEMLRQIQTEAIRQDRSLSWVVQQAWKISRERVMKMPSVKDALAQSTRETAPPAVKDPPAGTN
jgi:uncharacterized small protein (TIGR04563 family)